MIYIERRFYGKTITELSNKFYKIKNSGWIKSFRNDSGAIGHTFEKLIGINCNELEIPNFNQIEIKTKTKYSDSYTTLFCCTPTGPHYHEVERLKNKYGYPDSKLKNYNVLNTSICSKQKKQSRIEFFV